MEISVRIPTPLRRLTNGEDKVTLSSTTIKDMVDALARVTDQVKEIKYLRKVTETITNEY